MPYCRIHFQNIYFTNNACKPDWTVPDGNAYMRARAGNSRRWPVNSRNQIYCRIFCPEKKDKGYVNFLAALLCCTAVSTIIAVLIIKNATFIAKVFLSDNLCKSLLIIAAYSLPFACIHSVISSYFIGLELHILPAAAQVIEQVIRITCVFTFAGIAEQNGEGPDASTALYGILAGEIASSVFCFIAVIFLKDRYKTEEAALSKTPLYYISEG